MHVDLVARKEWIEREKEREKPRRWNSPLKRGEGRGIKGKGERGKGKRENQFVGAKFFPLNLLYG